MTMIEKIGRALAAYTDDRYASHKEFWDRHVLVMLEAMREPTKAMLNAGANSEHGDDYHYAAPRHTWPLMIDAAIAEHAATAIGNRRA